jgi:hypothetical protein
VNDTEWKPSSRSNCQGGSRLKIRRRKACSRVRFLCRMALGVPDLWKARISMFSGLLADLMVRRLPLHVAMLAIACIPSKSKQCTRRLVDGYEYLRRGRAPQNRIIRKIPPSKCGTGENDAPPRPVCGPRLMDTTRPPSTSPGHSSFRQNLRLAPPHLGVQMK